MPEPDRGSFEDDVVAMYEKNGRVLVRHARRCLKEAGIPASRVGAEDIVQNAIVIALVNQDKKPIEDLGAYVYRVIANQVRDEARRRGVADPIDSTEPGTAGGKVLWVSQVEDDVAGRLDVEKALREMSPQQRRLILLSKGVGYSHEELAQATRLHRGTIGRHIARATQALTTALGTMLVAAFFFVAAYVPTLTFPAPDPAGPSEDYLTEIFSGAVAALAAIGMLLIKSRLGKYRGNALALRRDLVLHKLLRMQQQVREDVGKDFPTPADYAACLGIRERWINEAVLRKGRVYVPEGQEGSVIPLYMLLPLTRYVTGVSISENGNNVIILDATKSRY
ncbi:sigma-70 family RNA polymerase sigma factor [Streptomyces sp. NPDC091371]|uniref:RNA polymerase sigma factor n=1 Tax=Streptomyces sp. NPDC091371 TaxID=3155303 RepID=UPI00342D0386